MTAPLEKAGSIYSVPVFRAPPAIDEPADHPRISQRDPNDRKLRNLILLANTIAWIIIIVFVRYALF
jgi:hypothetical protein